MKQGRFFRLTSLPVSGGSHRQEQRLLAFRADHYMTGNFFGIESKAIKPENMLWHLADLDNKGYPFDSIGIQFSGYFTDNAPPSTAACELVKQWNEKYEYSEIKACRCQ